MLVLSRKLGEKILIGTDVTITVVDIDRGKVRLGVEAPRDVPIFRQELLAKENRDASRQRKGSTQRGQDTGAEGPGGSGVEGSGG